MSDNIGPVRYIAVKSSHAARCQAIWSSNSTTDYWPCPFVKDLAGAGLPESSPFQLHDDVHGNHKHSSPLTFSANGGLVVVHIADDQGNYDGWEYYPPAGAQAS